MPPKISDKPGFTVRAALVAVSLSLFLLASSTYIALKIGALPWPIVFSVIVSGGLIKLLNGKRAVDVNEVNVTQAGASIGGLIAAGIAFTLPGILYLNQTAETNIPWPNTWLLGLLTALAGLLGVLLSVPLKQTFVDRENLPYPAGTAGAELLLAGKAGGKQLTTILIFGLVAAIFALLRDVYFPVGITFTSLVTAGFFITLYPMPLAISSGYILGPRAGFSWFAGGLVGWLIIVPLLFSEGFEAASAQGWIQNLGMGLVLGSGIGFFLSYVLPRIKSIFQPVFQDSRNLFRFYPILSILGLFGMLLVGVPLWASAIAVLGVWIMVTVAGRMTGETNINPLEQFGIFVGLVIAFIYSFFEAELSMFASFMIVIFVSVATAVAGDAGHDFKSAAIVGTDFRDIVRVDLIAAIFTGFAAPFVIDLVRNGFAEKLFTEAMPAPQAVLVAGSISGFAYPNIFLTGFAIALLWEIGSAFLPKKYRNKILIMPFGIGLFLGLALAIPLALGALIRTIIDKRYNHLYHSGLLIAAGVMGGEGIAGFSAGALTTAGLPFATGAFGLIVAFSIILIGILSKKMTK